MAARAAVAGLSLIHGRPPRRDLLDLASVDTLHMHGFVRLRRLLTPTQCSEILHYLRPQLMSAVRGNGSSFDLTSVPAGTSMANYPLGTVVNCPHIMNLANHSDVLAMAARYLGYTPTITLMSMRWSFADGAADIDVQGFHRDSEAASIKLFVYLTDVGEDTGPHRYVAGSHRERMPMRLHRYADSEVNIRHGGSIGILGPAGTAFVIDSKGIHKGTPLVRGARLLLGIQYSLLPIPIYDYTPVTYLGIGRFDPYINRLMIKPVRQHARCHAQKANIAPLVE
jgi:hypothetical protein